MLMNQVWCTMIGVDLILGAPFLQDQNIQLVVTLRLRVTHQHQIQVRQTVFLVAFVEDFCHFCPPPLDFDEIQKNIRVHEQTLTLILIEVFFREAPTSSRVLNDSQECIFILSPPL